MSDDELRIIVRKLAEIYLDGELTGRAFAWTVESLIATSGIEERDEQLGVLAELLAASSPEGGEGLYDETELKDTFWDSSGRAAAWSSALPVIVGMYSHTDHMGPASDRQPVRQKVALHVGRVTVHEDCCTKSGAGGPRGPRPNDRGGYSEWYPLS